jgi:signal transduction histidine kinase/CheY-like chemotaxis protein
MSKKNPQSRLNELFSELEVVDGQTPATRSVLAPTWSWECNNKGEYTQIGPEIETYMGIPAANFIGQSFFSSGVAPQSVPVLREAISEGVFPTELQINFVSSKTGLLPVRISIFSRPAVNGTAESYYGYAQIVGDNQFFSHPDAPDEITFDIDDLALPTDPDGHKTALPDEVTVIPLEDLPIIEKALSTPEKQRTATPADEINKKKAQKPNSSHVEPAVISIPVSLRDQGSAKLEIVADDRRRKWSEDDRLLIEEVAAQLELAIENAQLYAAVQQELSERVRAENEINRRNQDLSSLNQIGQQLNKLATPEEIYTQVTAMLSQVFEFDRLTLAAYDPKTDLVSFPSTVEPHGEIGENSRDLSINLANWMVHANESLFLDHDVHSELTAKSIKISDKIPLSILAVPMSTGEKVIGAILLENYHRAEAFDPTHLDLLSTVASQIAVALENASLFQEIRTALDAIETRERYQANMARSVALLSENGTQSINEMLSALADATKASRVYYASIIGEDQDMSWQPIADWKKDGVKESVNKTIIPALPVSQFSNWVAELKEKGFVSLNSSRCTDSEHEYLRSQGINSSLLLAVGGKGSTPGYLAFEDENQDREWQSEEINVLRVAADALANTIVREDLLGQLQSSLDESEGLYNASHRMALANEPKEMVAAITLGIHVPAINRAILVLFDYDQIGNISHLRVAANWYSGWGTPPSAVGAEFVRTVYERTFMIPTPVFIDDTSEGSLEAPIRDAFLRQNVHSLAILPMWAGKQQMGVLLLQSEEKHQFTSREIRSYPPLVDQMATSIENTQLFQQTQSALKETEQLYRITNGIAQARNADDLVNLVVENLLPHMADRAAIVEVNLNAKGQLSDIEFIANQTRSGEDRWPEAKEPGSAFPFFEEISGDLRIIKNLRDSNLDPVSQGFLAKYGIQSGVFAPLRSAGKIIGLLIVSSGQPMEVNQDELRAIQVAANSISVAIERQRLLGEAQRRALELQAAAEIARDTASTLSQGVLLNRIVNLIRERFGYYHASVFLLDETRNYAVVSEATGDAGEDMKKRNHKLAVGSRSVIGTVTRTAKPLVVNDVHRSDMFLANPFLPDTQSEMAIPLKIGERIIGALDIQSEKTAAFSTAELSVFLILADQIAIAIENARAYELSQKAYEEIKEVDRVKNQFLANMSHELRTPLNSIIGFSRVILKGIDGPINETQNQDLTAIYSSGQHLLHLINDILDLSKIEAGKMELQFADVNLGDMVNSVMSTAIGLVKDKPIKLFHKVDPKLPDIRCDATRVRQVLINFLSNAAKFTDEGSITVEVRPNIDPQGKSEVLVTVTDTGLGIAEKDQSKLFQPFSQVDDSPTRKSGGTGLGLSICRSLIDMHSGRIGLLSSEVGVGSTFFFALPMPTPVDVVSDKSGTKIQGPMDVILCIDDDPQIIYLYERFLKTQGYKVAALTDPKKAVQFAKEVHPFAITLDIMMPEKDGWQVMAELKADPETRHIPIIICSILQEEERGFSLGAADYLVKPFLQEELANAINRLNKDQKIHEIMIIDDDADDRRLLKKLVEDNENMHAVLAEGGKSGLELITAKPPDAIVLDLFMPEMDGFAVLQQLRTNSLWNRIPVVILTGADLTADQQKQLNEFGKDMLLKSSLRESDLLAMLEETLQKLRLPQN